MDTTENELRALRKELDAFRNENIALYNELTNQNKTLYEQVISIGKELAYQNRILLNTVNTVGNSRNLEIYLTRFAGMQTAEFVHYNMPKVKSFDNRKDHLKFALSQVGNAVGGGVILGVRRLSRQHHKSYLVDVAR